MIDFTNCKKINTTAFGGNNGLKIALEYEGAPYMIKFAPHPKNNADLSYTNSCISEHIGCNVFNMLGIPAQETKLGYYLRNNKRYMVVACRDFAGDSSTLLEFAKIKNSVLDSSYGGQGLDLEDVLLSIDEQEFFDPLKMKQRFWEMFVVDAYIGNFDRNNSNWGLLVNRNTKVLSLAPVYDCGGCLYPQLDDGAMEKILQDRVEIENRIYVFPNSIYKNDGKKINYLDYLRNTRIQECKDALQRILQKLDENKVNAFIDGIDGIADIRKNFYKTILHYRKEWILEAALKEN